MKRNWTPIRHTEKGAAISIIPPGQLMTAIGGSTALRLSSNGTLLFVPQNFQAKRLVKVAQDGSAVALDLPPGPYSMPRVSPGFRRIVFVTGGSQLEAWNEDRRARERLAAAAPGTNFPIWNQDGTRIFFRRFNSLFWASADGTRQGQVPGGLANDYPSGHGPDPNTFLVTRVQGETAGDVLLFSSSGAFQPKPLISTPAYEGGAQLSPDGRWLVYVSIDSGQSAILLRRYPALDRQWQISEGSGIQPRWSTSGREIYYRDGAHMMAVPFDGSRDEPVIGKAKALFKDEYDLGYGITIANYDVTQEGRFLMLRRDPQGGNFRLILNWTEELKQILAKGGVR